MENFKELFESPVGMVGRTSGLEASEYVTPELEAKFKKIVRELGGKAVAMHLLKNMRMSAKPSAVVDAE